MEDRQRESTENVTMPHSLMVTINRPSGTVECTWFGHDFVYSFMQCIIWCFVFLHKVSRLLCPRLLPWGIRHWFAVNLFHLFLAFSIFAFATVAFVCSAVSYTRPCITSSFNFFLQIVTRCAINNPWVMPYLSYSGDGITPCHRHGGMWVSDSTFEKLWFAFQPFH